MIKFSDNYPMLKDYKDIETYMEELRHYVNIIENIEIDRIEAQKQIVRDKEEIERLNNIINELEEDLIEYFKKEYLDRKIEDYNLEYCTYDYALVILGKLQKLKGDGSNE